MASDRVFGLPVTQMMGSTGGWPATPSANLTATLKTLKPVQSLDSHLHWNDQNNTLIKVPTPVFQGTIGVKEACDNATHAGNILLRGA